MQIRFKQAAHLKSKSGKGKDYSLGAHEVPKEHLETPHFQNLLKAGLVSEVGDERVPTPGEAQDENKRLAEVIASRQKHSEIPSDNPGAALTDGNDDPDSSLPSDSAPSEEDQAEFDDSDGGDEEESAPKKKIKHKSKR